MNARTNLLALALLSLSLIGIGGGAFYWHIEEMADIEARRNAESTAFMLSEQISYYFDRQSRVSQALAGSPLFSRALALRDTESLDAVNALLDHSCETLGAAVCYLMGPQGKTIASSNRNTPTSFLGKNYAFRPYFKEALGGKPAVYLALGVTSKKRGIYFSSPILGANGTVDGVLVLKASVQDLEAQFRNYSGIAALIDSEGVVFASNRKDWLYQGIRPLTVEEAQNIRETRQYGPNQPKWLGLRDIPGGRVTHPDGSTYLICYKNLVQPAGWEVAYLFDVAGISVFNPANPLNKTFALGFGAIFLITGFFVVFLYRTGSRDIRRRHEAEEALKHSQRIMKDAEQVARFGSLEWDLVENSQFWSDEIWRIIGREPRSFQPTEKAIADILDPDDKKRVLVAVGEALEFGKPFDVECRIVRPDGTRRYLHTLGQVFRDESGRPLRMTGTAQDITERKQAEEALRDNERRLQNFIDSSPSNLAYVDSDLRYRQVNARYLNFVGKTEEQVIGHTAAEVLGEAAFELYRPWMEKALGGQEQRFEASRPVRDLGMRDLEVRYIPNVDPHGRVLGFHASAEDITERKRADEALRESRELEKRTHSRLMDAIESLPGSFAIYDAEDRLVLSNSKTLEMFPEHVAILKPGTSYEEVIRLSVEKGLIQVDSGDQEAYIQKRLREFKEKPEIIEHQWRDGRWFAIYQRQTSDGGTVSIRLDITERKQAERDLQSQKRLFQTVFDALPLWVTVKGKDLRYILHNRQVLSDLQMSPEEFTATNTETLPYGTRQEKALVQELDLKILEGESEHLVSEIPISHPDGRQRIYHSVKAPLLDDEGQVAGVVNVSQDITERKQAEEELIRMATALEQAGNCVFITDTTGIIQYVNSAFEDLTGYTREEAIGQSPSILNSGLMERNFFRKLWETLQRGEVWQGKYTNRRKDGTVFEVDAMNSPLRNEQGEIINFISVQKDISQQTLLENQSRHSQRLEALGTLAGGIAHDFNNLLTPIFGYAEMMLEKTEGRGKEHDYMNVILRSATRAKDLVSQILLFSRRGQSDKSISDLSPIVEEVVKFMGSTLSKTLSIQHSISDDVAPVFCNPSQMHQMIVNLCVNAGQAMADAGELKINLKTVELGGLKCIVGKILSGKYVQLTVTDTGIGMDSDTLSKIFDPFFTTKELGEGTGLGLSTVFGIVQNHEGGILVSSEPGRGTTFEIYLPATDKPAKNQSVIDISIPRGGESILFIDDEEEIAEMGKHMLEEFGYKVTASSDSQEALKIFEADPNRFDVVVTDQGMPHLKGDQLSAEIRQARPDIPIILCTGHSHTMTPESSKAAGINAFLYKPVRRKEMGEVLRRVLDESRKAGL